MFTLFSLWRFHTGLCKFLRNISTNIWSLGRRTGLKLGEVPYNFLSSITSQFRSFFHWIVFNLFISVAWQWKTIYWKICRIHTASGGLGRTSGYYPSLHSALAENMADWMLIMSSKARSDGGELENQFILRVPQVTWVSLRAGVNLMLLLVIFSCCGFQKVFMLIMFDMFYLSNAEIARVFKL